MSPDAGPEFIQRLKQGDEPAFKEFIDMFKKKAYLVALGWTGRHHEAVALSQEAFVRAWFGLKHFRGKSSLYTWFHRILINLCLHYRRRQSKRPRWFFTQDKQEAQNEPYALDEEVFVAPRDKNGRQDPARPLLNRELALKIDEAVRALPDYQRVVFILRQLQGLNIKQTAEILGCRPGTVKAHLFRARQKLRRLLRPYLKDEI